MGIALEVAKEADLPGIVALMNAAFRGSGGWTGEAGYITGARTSETLLREDIAGGAHFLVAKKEALWGCVSLRALSRERWYLGALTVDPGLQNAGLGRKMLEAAEEYARVRGARWMEMTVIQIRETLIAWYERRGYRRTGERRGFPYGDERFGRPLREDLEFVVLEKELVAADGRNTEIPAAPQ